MVKTAAHLTDHVLPRLPVRQWVLSAPKRLRYFRRRDGAVLNMELRIFPRVIEQRLYQHRPVRRRWTGQACASPRTHRHRYSGVLTPHSPLRANVTARAASAQQTSAQTGQTGTSVGSPGVAPEGNAVGAGAQLRQPEPVQPEPVPPKRSPAHYPWAVLSARIYELFPLVCPLSGGSMRRARSLRRRHR